MPQRPHKGKVGIGGVKGLHGVLLRGVALLCAAVWGALWFSFEYLSTGLLVLE